jgi:hypothetical protein
MPTWLYVAAAAAGVAGNLALLHSYRPDLAVRLCSARFEHHLATGHVRRATWWSGLACKLLRIRVS